MITLDDVLKEISMFDSSKAIQATDIPVKVIKDNKVITVIFLHIKCGLISMNLLVKENCLKLANITPVFK